MKSTSKKVRLACLFGVCLTPVTMPAALINWIADATTITSDSDIDLTGDLARAGTWGSAAVMLDLGSETIMFNDEVTNTPAAEVSVTADSSTAIAGEDANPDYLDSTGLAVSSDFETVLDSFAWDGPNPKVLTLNNLIAGQDYQIQLFVSDDRGCCSGRTQLWSDSATVGAGNETSTFAHTDSTYVIGEFTADGSGIQEIYGHGIGQVQTALNAYVLRTVPEPSSALLAGLGGLLLIRRRR